MKILLATLLSYTAAITCIDESGNSVDKWVIFKYPQGHDYAYWDPHTPLHMTNTSLNSTYSGALANTMNQLWMYYMSEYIMWNDEIPNSDDYNTNMGHSKGLWMWDMTNTTGVFLHHSIPKWPMSPAESPESYAGLPPNAWTYGQHIACFTVTYDELQAISEAYLYIEPQIYATRGLFPLLEELTNPNKSVETQIPTCTYSKYVVSELVGFAKNAKWNNDLYDDCIAPTFQESLFVESWRHGESPLGPFCGLQNVSNVESLKIDGRSFTTMEDHSKWTVTVVNTNYVCFSDINRMQSQFQRGGGAICFQDAQFVSDLRSAIQETDQCE